MGGDKTGKSALSITIVEDVNNEPKHIAKHTTSRKSFRGSDNIIKVAAAWQCWRVLLTVVAEAACRF